MRTMLPLSLTLSLALLPGCSHDHDHDQANDPKAPAAGAPPDEHGHVHGDRVSLGKVALATHSIEVFKVAPIVPGKEADFDLDFAGELPATMRGWIGLESGKGSRKVRFEREAERRMHGHPECPDPLPEGSAIWLEVESGGTTARATLPLPR